MVKNGVDYLLRGIPTDLHKSMKVRAAQEGITVKDLIIKAVTEYLTKKGR